MPDDKRDGAGRFQRGVSGNPSGRRRAPRRDGYKNFFTGHGVFGRDKREGTHFHTQHLNFDQLAELAEGDDLAARAAETMPREALRKGYDLIISELKDRGRADAFGAPPPKPEDPDKDPDPDHDDSSDRISEITNKLDTLASDKTLENALTFERIYGGSAILLGANDGQKDLSQPLNLDKVRSLDSLTLLEPREIMPIYGYVDPRAPKYGEAEIYRMVSRTVYPSHDGSYPTGMLDIHESRLLTFNGIRVSRYRSTALQGGWGLSVLTRMWRVLRDFNLSWSSAGVLATDFAGSIYKMKDLWDAVAADNAEAFKARLEAMELGKSTVNMTVIDKDDDYIRQQTPITGLPDLLDRFATRLAAAADMPLTLLFGTSPGGLNATGESDIRFFYDRVAAYQTSKLLPQLRRLIQIVMRVTGDKKEPKKWQIRFRPLWQESAKDRAAAMLTQAQADGAWIDRGVLSSEEVADSHWGSGEYNPEISVDFDARERQEQATSGPIDQGDINALNPEHPDYRPSKLDPNHPEYLPPPPQDTPDPNTPDRPYIGTGDSLSFMRRQDAEWDEGLHPRASDGKFGEGSGGKRSGGRLSTPANWATRGSDQKIHVLGDLSRGAREASAGAKTASEHAHASELHTSAAMAHQEFAGYMRGEAAHEKATGYRQASRYTAATATRSEQAAREHLGEAKKSRTAAGTAEALAHTANQQGGFTYDPKTGGFPKEGFALSIHPGHEEVIRSKELDPAAIRGYLDKHGEFIKNNPGAHIGGWYDAEAGKWYLDVSHVTHDRGEAEHLAKANNQEAYYDLAKHESVYVKSGVDRRIDQDPAAGHEEDLLRPHEDDPRGDRGRDEGARGAGERAPGQEVRDAWSEAAREAALEARKANAKGGEEKPKIGVNAHAELTQKAVEASHKAIEHGGRAHEEAVKAHERAAEVLREAGHEARATLHETAAELHRKLSEHEKPEHEKPEKKPEHEKPEGGEKKRHESHLVDILHLLTGQHEGQ